MVLLMEPLHIPGVPRRACAMVNFSWGARHWQLVSSANGAGAVRVWKMEKKTKKVNLFLPSSN